jgi:hypothetical protein
MPLAMARRLVALLNVAVSRTAATTSRWPNRDQPRKSL